MEQGFGLLGVKNGQGAGVGAAGGEFLVGAAGGVARRGQHGQQRGGGRGAGVTGQDLCGGGVEFGPAVLA